MRGSPVRIRVAAPIFTAFEQSCGSTLPRRQCTELVPGRPIGGHPARNNLIGWIAGRSDGEHHGEAVAYDFPKTKLIDGPLQIEARIDQNAQLSGQLSLWNQQGSHVRRGSLIVNPIGRALLYAEPIYLQADRSPMPELRLVVLTGRRSNRRWPPCLGRPPRCSARKSLRSLPRHGRRAPHPWPPQLRAIPVG